MKIIVSGNFEMKKYIGSKIMYTEKDLVAIAKRENNNKRNYLVVNRLQGKHIPVESEYSLDMFKELAGMVLEEYKDEKILVVGFAETATAIGSAVAVSTNSYYMQTTRENIENVEYLYFTESHSHATEQKLIKTDLDKIIDEIQRIVFVEDEVTTGNTILKIIDIIEKTYPKNIQFSVASLLNGMDEVAREVYESRNIRMHYLVKTDHSAYIDIAEQFEGNGEYCSYPQVCKTELKVYKAEHYLNARRLQTGSAYKEACDKLCKQIMQWLTFEKGEKILVLGTEEFMYPAIYVGAAITKKGCEVKSHSTTRSPIAVSKEEEYPVHVRYELHSFYDDERRTFIYDLDKYDKVLIITDSVNQSKQGMKDLCSNLAKCGNTNIHVIEWY